MANIFVLGGGRVGSAIASLLSKDHVVTVLDFFIKERQSTKTLSWKKIDFNDLSSLNNKIKNADIVVGAVPGHFGYRVLKKVIECNKNIVDISFFPENGMVLNNLAKKNNVIATIDCGVAPGMDNILLGHHDKYMNVNSFKCMVGGLPIIKNHPFNYKAPFSPIDVLEEYTRPARIMRGGNIITLPALTELELIRNPRAGTLEAFNSDGLRSLLFTMKHIPNMVEKTIRYKGHADQMFLLREIGLFDKKTRNISGQKIIPLTLTSALLFDHWKYNKSEKDMTIMQVKIEGEEMNKKVSYLYDLYDEYNVNTEMSSMARTTGVTACAVVECILKGIWKDPGVIPPENIGKKDDCFSYIMKYQLEHGIQYKVKKKIIN